MMTEIKQEIKIDESFYKVKQVRRLTKDTFSIILPKSRFKYKAGQHLSLGIQGNYQSREYSIYSGENDETLEVLVKEVKEGYFSPRLGDLKPGDLVEVHGPFGKFYIEDKLIPDNKFVFIASGTGIAPFRSMIRSKSNLDYTLIHGVRHSYEAYDKEEYDFERHVVCSTADQDGDYHGRLTGYLKQSNFEENTHFYLCGNSNMIFDALEILKDKGFDRDRVHCEVYF